jgi:hypothetical protein
MGDVKNMPAKKQPINDMKNKWQPTTVTSAATLRLPLH